MLSMENHPIQSEEAHQKGFYRHEKQYDCLCHSNDAEKLLTVSFSWAFQIFNCVK